MKPAVCAAGTIEPAQMIQSSQLAQQWQRSRDAIDFVLVEPSHPGNVGAAARALAVMGFERLTLVSPRHANANDHAEARAFASGADHILDACRIVDSLEQALADARFTVAVSAAGREFAQPPQAPQEIAAQLLQLPGPVALVFGTERNGLTIEQAGKCQAMCSIQADPSHSSLNLAQAVQVLAYVMRQAINGQPPLNDKPGGVDRPDASTGPSATANPRDLPASHQQLEGMFDHLQQALTDIGYFDPAEPKRLMPRLRNLFNRARPTVTEVDILRGICNEMTNRQNTPKK